MTNISEFKFKLGMDEVNEEPHFRVPFKIVFIMNFFDVLIYF